MSAGSIPFTAVSQYAARFGLEGEDFDFFLDMIRAMDKAALDHARGNKASPGKPTARVVSSRKLSPELFKKLF